MKYQLSITINKPIREVTRLFANRPLLPQWQPDLLNSRQIENYPFPKYVHQLALGRRKIQMTELILRNDLPNHYEVQFILKGITSHVNHSFDEINSSSTRWHCHTQYRFRGLMKFISIFTKGSLKKQSEIMMRNFKGFAESRN